MYLITTTNYKINGYEIVAIGSKNEMNQALDLLKKKVWYNEDGSQKPFSNIFDDTSAKNARIVTKKEAKKIFGGQVGLNNAEDYYYEYA